MSDKYKIIQAFNENINLEKMKILEKKQKKFI